MKPLFSLMLSLCCFTVNAGPWLPQEKVYIHFDNTSYYHGDKIWFRCYLVSPGENIPSPLSKTIYVELLNPGGEIVDKRILKVEDGGCHGDFTLDRQPFYSGFYEVRAYTKYMLNFGEETIFSRLLPVYDKPETPGDFEDKEMMRYDIAARDFPFKRLRPERYKKLNVRFFPEGGNLVMGVPSRVAFEATDRLGNPVEITGTVAPDGQAGSEPISFATTHEGRGVFTCTPVIAEKPRKIEVDYEGAKYGFDLPEALPQGVVMEVDNTSEPDSVIVTLRKNAATPNQSLEVTTISGGKLQNAIPVRIETDEISFRIDKSGLPTGVSQIVLSDGSGALLCDRLIFKTPGSSTLSIVATTDKPGYRPFEKVEMEFAVKNGDGNPASVPFSLAVRDSANEVEHRGNIMTDLLLMSEIRSYVRDPLYYFESYGPTRRAELDLLLMVQGWRRYSRQILETEPSELKYLPEQGIEMHGRVVSHTMFGGREVHKSGVDVNMFMSRRAGDAESELDGYAAENYTTDSLGRFAFVTDATGRWEVGLGITEKGKAKDYRIMFDRLSGLAPRRYGYTDLQVTLARAAQEPESDGETTLEETSPVEELLQFMVDSLARAGIDGETIHNIEQIEVRAGRRTREDDIRRNRSTSVAYYDAKQEMDDIYDRGIYIGDNIDDILKNTNENFTTLPQGMRQECLLYKNRIALVVVDYERVLWHPQNGLFKYRSTRINAIKNIYINETPEIIGRYIIPPDPRILVSDLVPFCGCVVFVETYSDGEIPPGDEKGVRRTVMEGYTPPAEFRSPDYSILPPQEDYRRTLYWNPAVEVDENGTAKVSFYNNGSATGFTVSAETVSPAGVTGMSEN